MLVTAFWKRLDLPGRDAARVRRTPAGYDLSGQAVFLDPAGPAALRYVLDLGPDWSTRQGRITGFIGERTIDSHIVRGMRGWTVNGRDCGLADVIDLDLGFTPATNMVQLRRVAPAQGDRVEFDVAWCDGGEDDLTRLPQVYRRLSAFDYAYEAPTVGYAGTIVLAPSGFAASYPGLWELEG